MVGRHKMTGKNVYLLEKKINPAGVEGSMRLRGKFGLGKDFEEWEKRLS